MSWDPDPAHLRGRASEFGEDADTPYDWADIYGPADLREAEQHREAVDGYVGADPRD